MALRQQMLVKLQREIHAMKEQQRAGYVQGYQGKQLATMEESDMFKPKDPGVDGPMGVGGGGYHGGRNQNMTEEHRAALHVLKERDVKMDAVITEIGKGVDDLYQLARTANEEVKLQSKMIDHLETKIDDVHEHVTNINAKLKTTLEEARNSDKICVDILCLLLLIGMIVILVKINNDNKKK